MIARAHPEMCLGGGQNALIFDYEIHCIIKVVFCYRVFDYTHIKIFNQYFIFDLMDIEKYCPLNWFAMIFILQFLLNHFLLRVHIMFSKKL